MTVQSHRPLTSAARLARAAAEDRRRYQRQNSLGMLANVNGVMHEVEDVAVGGLRLPRLGMMPGDELVLQLLPRDGTKVLLNDAVRAKAVVVGECRNWTRLEFSPLTFGLSKFIIRHMARLTGAKPFIFK